jgi:hypothetical protein
VDAADRAERRFVCVEVLLGDDAVILAASHAQKEARRFRRRVNLYKALYYVFAVARPAYPRVLSVEDAKASTLRGLCHREGKK